MKVLAAQLDRARQETGLFSPRSSSTTSGAGSWSSRGTRSTS
ncbi:MAG: hypothetical protein WKF75_04730 [Singulisphaera sp.]